MRFLNTIIMLFAFTVGFSTNAAALQRTSLTTERVLIHNSTLDHYCPTKEQRGISCPGGKRDRCTPLMRAAERGRLKDVRSLLAAGVDVNAKLANGETALMFAASEDYPEIVKVLLAAGANPNSIGGTFHYGPFVAWMSALNRCNKHWLEMFDAMLAAGVDLNPAIDVDFSPLGYAILRQQDPIMIEALVKRGANVNLTDSKTGETPLMFAVRFSSPQVVKALIDAGSNVNATNKKGASVLAVAEMSSENIWQREIVLLLMHSGAKR